MTWERESCPTGLQEDYSGIFCFSGFSFLIFFFFFFLSSQDSSDWAFILSFNGCAQNDWTVQKLAKAVPPSRGGQRGLGVEVGQGDRKDIGKRQRMVFVQRVLPWKVREGRKMWLKRKNCFFAYAKGISAEYLLEGSVVTLTEVDRKARKWQPGTEISVSHFLTHSTQSSVRLSCVPIIF